MLPSEVSSSKGGNFWPVREYLVWFANGWEKNPVGFFEFLMMSG
jgi:hypothetical protein